MTVGKLSAQGFVAQVPKDSLQVLTQRVEALKASLKIYELKVKEASEEVEVEKLRVKLVQANETAKKSAQNNSDMAAKLKKGTTDSKTAEKIAKQAKNDTADAQKAIERYHKQISKVETLRTEIRNEERKLTARQPTVIFN